MASEQKSSTSVAAGIVGLPNVGKSTLFNALIRKKSAPAENFPFCTIDPNVGIVEVKDPRLDVLAKMSKSKKIVNAALTLVDIAGLVKGASKGEGLGNQFLTHIRQTDAILQVVRCFEDENIVHVSGKINPLEDIQTINLELVLADLQMAENILQKLEKQAKGNKELQPHIDLIKKVIIHLNEEKPLRVLKITPEEKTILSNYSFLTAKKILYIANIKEQDLSKENPYLKLVQEYAKQEGSLVIPICAKLEEEISDLNEQEAKEFLQSLGVQETGLDRLIKAAFDLLGLLTFITTGEIETKAWTITKGTTAQQAAGKIHSDLEKGFIRAEVVSYDDMVQYGGRVEAREVGKARSEGKDYIVKDGDVILFFHNA
jgi:GTP-binding protein YchF